MHSSSIFFKSVNKLCVNFLRLWTKNPNCWEILKFFDENSIEKLNFLFLFFRKFVTKIELSEIIPFFYNIFSVSRGGGISPSVSAIGSMYFALIISFISDLEPSVSIYNLIHWIFLSLLINNQIGQAFKRELDYGSFIFSNDAKY